MSRFSRAVFAVVIMVAALSGIAGAEITLPVNDNNTGIFDQPSVAMNGSKALVAYIGKTAASGDGFWVYFASVNGDSNFANLSLVRDNTVILTSPMAVDNTGLSGNAPYYDARHPKIVLRSSTEAVIMFQAKPTADNVFRPYIARITLSNNAATLASVREVTGFPAGDLTDGNIEQLSFGIVAIDNTARIAFGNRSAAGSGPFQVYFARVRLNIDNTVVVGTPILLSSSPGYDGLLPLPSIGLDTLNRSHIVWVANYDPLVSSPVYYAMIKETNGIDNRVISASELHGDGKTWGYPNIHVFNNSSIVATAVDETAADQTGNVLIINFNPDADNQDGTPVQVASNSSFFPSPKIILEDKYNLYRPSSFLDTSGRLHFTGYGRAEGNGTGWHGTYYALQLISTTPFFQELQARKDTSMDFQGYPTCLAGDYTRAAFGYLSGKTVVFWSGQVPVGGTNRNLDVSAITTITLPIPFKESGCAMVPDPGAGESGRMAGTAFLLLPAMVLAIRRMIRRSQSFDRRSVGD